jgi:hypothetical protein
VVVRGLGRIEGLGTSARRRHVLASKQMLGEQDTKQGRRHVARKASFSHGLFDKPDLFSEGPDQLQGLGGI